VFELFSFLSILFPRTAPFILANAFLFQVGLYVMAGHEFLQHLVLLLLLLVFLDTGWWRAGLKKYFNVDASWWLEPERAVGS